jgi:hypothetical protein
LVVAGGAFLAGAGFLLMGTTASAGTAFHLAGVLAGAGMAGLLSPSLRHKAIGDIPVADHVQAQRILFMFTGIGRLLGAAAIGAFAASGSEAVAGYRNAFIALGCFAFVVFLFSLLLTSRKPPE